MIPVLLLLGFVAGLLPRGWGAVIVAAIGWPLLLVALGVDSGWGFVGGASALATANTALGVLVGVGVRALLTRVRRG